MTPGQRIAPNSRLWTLLLLLFLLGAVLPAWAVAPSADPEAAHRIFRWRPFLAPFHAVVLHFPIGFLTVGFILELYRIKRPSEELRRVTVLVIWLSFLAGIITATFGILRAGPGGYESHSLQLHRAFGLSIPVFTLATLALQKIASRSQAPRGWTYGYRSLLTLTLGLVVIAGHLGGNLTHGSQYLVEHAPRFVRELIHENSDPNPGHDAAVLDEKQRVYTEKVQPIFAEKCYGCHGAEKQKGGYRLDQPQLALKGGDSERPAIKPGDPIESHLIRLILLPPHHDDVMPPDGKQPLTLEEIMTIIDWIRNGAIFPGTPSSMAASP